MFFEEFYVDNKRNTPTAHDLLTYHNDDNGYYTLMCDLFLPHVVGAVKWHQKCVDQKLSDFVCVGDEDFTILTIENNELAWRDQVDNNWKVSHKPSKYTDGGKCSSKGRSRSLHGWDTVGLHRFNFLFDNIAKSHKTADHEAFEILYLAHRKRLLEAHENKLKKPKINKNKFDNNENKIDMIHDEMDIVEV